jgi:branched-chain amino acid transport system substrate-binding protein
MITHGRYSPHYDTEPNNAFVEAFTEEHELPPNQNAKDAWEGIHFYKAAVEENGSTSFGDVTSAAEEVTIDSLMGSLSMRDCDHRCVRPMHVAEVGENDEWGVPRFNILETVPAEQVMESCEQTTCSF